MLPSEGDQRLFRLSSPLGRVGGQAGDVALQGGHRRLPLAGVVLAERGPEQHLPRAGAADLGRPPEARLGLGVPLHLEQALGLETPTERDVRAGGQNNVSPS